MVDLPEPERPVKKMVTVVFLDFVIGDVAILILEVDHHVERHHGHADIGFVLFENFLRFVRTIERLAVRILAGAGVIAADDEVGAAVVFPDERVPDGLAWSAHAHGEREQRKLRSALREFWKQQLIAAHAGVVIDVAWLGHAYDGMNQQVGFDLFSRAEGEFYVGAVHGISRLKRDHLGPAFAGKLGANFCGSEADGAEIVVRRNLQGFDFAADIPGIRLVHDVIGAGMGGAGAGENRLCFGFAIGLPYIFHMHHGEHHAFGITERDLARARSELLGEVFRHVQGDGHGPKNSAGQSHVFANAVVVGARHEAAERRESAGDQQLQITELAAG